MTNAEARFNKIHIRKVYACLAVTCHLRVVVVVDRLYIALFSALEQTHCARM